MKRAVATSACLVAVATWLGAIAALAEDPPASPFTAAELILAVGLALTGCP